MLLGTLVGFWESHIDFDKKIPESRFLFGPVGPANLSFSVRSVHRGDTLVRSVRSVAYTSEFGRSGPTVVEIRSGGPTGPVPPPRGVHSHFGHPKGLFGRRPGHPRPFRPKAGHSRPAASFAAGVNGIYLIKRQKSGEKI